MLKELKPDSWKNYTNYANKANRTSLLEVTILGAVVAEEEKYYLRNYSI